MTAEEQAGPRDYAAAAKALGVSESWLRDATPRAKLPHHKFSLNEHGEPSTDGRGTVVFYDEDIAAIREMFAVRPSSDPRQPLRPVSRRRAS